MSLAFRNNGFSAVSGPVTTTAGTATTFTGLVLWNPINSPINLYLTTATVLPVVAQTAGLIVGLQGGYSATAPTGTANPGSSNVFSANANTTVSFGKWQTASTLPVTPTLIQYLTSLQTGAITTTTEIGSPIPLTLEDSSPIIVLPPGGFVATYTSAASVASSIAFGFTWMEQ